MLKPSVEIHNVDGYLVAEFWDCLRLDPAPIQELRRKYEAHVLGKGRPELVIDLLGVGFAGSAALGHFVACLKLARQKGGQLIFCNVDPTVFEVFRVSKLDPLFTFLPDRAAAVAYAKNPQAPAATAGPTDGVDGQAPPPKPVQKQKPSGDTSLREFRRRKES
jgi:anti-anti-sigma factor